MFAFLNNFKTRLIFTTLIFAILSLVFFSFYFLKVQSNSTLEADVKEQISSNLMLGELMDASYYKQLYFILSSLQGLRREHEVAAAAIRNLYLATKSDPGTGPLVRSIMHDSLTSASYQIIIYDQDNPDRSVFIKPEYREVLNYNTIQNFKFSEFLTQISFTPKTNFFFLQNAKTRDEYLSSVTPLDKRVQIILVSNLKKFMHLRSSIRGAIIDNIKIPLERMNEEFGKNDWQHYVLDRTGNVIEPKSIKLKINFSQEFIEEIKKAPQQTLTTSIELNEIPSKSVISLYTPLNWYIVSSISDTDIVKAEKSLRTDIIYICMAMAIITIFCTYLLASSISNPLNQLTTTTHEIAKIDLRNTGEIKNIIKMLNSDKRVDEIGEISKVLSQMVFSLSLNMNRLLDKQNRQKLVEGELSAAADIQQGLLPCDLDLPEYLPYDIYGSLSPAKEVGGDLYDVIALPKNRLCLVMGDVSDKGVPAALFMTMTVTLIREGVSLNITLEQLIDSLNKTLCQRNPNLMFVTLFIGILDKQTGMLEYANAGHCQPMMVNRQGAVRALTELSGPAVGVDEDLVYTSYHDQLAEDETLVLYTDGVTEAQNIHQELYGDDRLYAFLSAHANLSSADLSAKLTEELTNFKGTAPQFDDITMLIVSHR